MVRVVFGVPDTDTGTGAFFTRGYTLTAAAGLNRPYEVHDCHGKC